MGNITKAWNRWKVALLITVGWRLALFIFSLAMNSHGQNNLLDLWIRWDGPHYIELSQHGYTSQGENALFIVFYPLYPFFIKLLSLLGVGYSAAALAIPTLFSIVSSILLYELARLDFNKRSALLSVWFLNIFPTSFFLQGSYTESMFLAFSLAAIYLFRKGQTIPAGISGLLASITRINGILLIPLFIIEARSFKRFLIASFLTPIGLGIYLLINYLTFGDFLYFTKPLKDHWFKELAFPTSGILNLINLMGTPSNPNFYIFFSELIALFFILAMTIIVFLRLRLSYGYYMFISLLLFTSTSFILSTPRYALILFPTFLVLGKISNRYAIAAISLVSIALLLVLTNLYTQGRWVS